MAKAKTKSGRVRRVLKVFNPRSFRGGMALFMLVFAAIGGGYMLYRSFAAGGSQSWHTCIVRPTDKTLWCWGYNGHGGLGVGGRIERKYPVKVFIGDAKEVVTGSGYTCASKTDGTLWCWGSNSLGELGVGGDSNSYVEHTRPVQVPIANVANISAGLGHTCASKTDGTLWCWGLNSNGQLGIGNTINQYSPKQLFFDKTASLTAGSEHTCASRTDGSLWCWGRNESGQLGIGNNINQNVPKQLYWGGTASLAAGVGHTCASRTDGSLWCWGNNLSGQLGIGNTTNQNVPKQLYWGGTTLLTSGGAHTCASRTDGTLWCWGDNGYGQLGIGDSSTTHQNGPRQALPKQLFFDKTALLTSGALHTCAGRTDGTLWCWGDNESGQLGIGNNTDQTGPKQLYFLWK